MAPKKPQPKPKLVGKPKKPAGKPKKKTGTKAPKPASGKPGPRKAAALAANEPDCLSMDDAIAKVRACAKKINSGLGDNIKMDTQIGMAFPGDDDQIACKRFLACIKDKTGFDLDPDDFCGGTLGDVAKALTCDGGDQ